MLRREIRKRKEFLYNKNKQALERETLERKKLLRSALEQGTPIPTELRDSEADLRKLMVYDDSRWESACEIDNEYRWVGVEDPRIVLTTSRNPSNRLKIFAKELRLIFPNCQKANRGDSNLSSLVDSCVSSGVTDLLLVHETHGNPDCLIVSHLPYGPTAYFTLYNVVMRHDIADIKTMSEAYPHLIFDNFSKPLGLRTMTILKSLFPVPKSSSRHHVYSKASDSPNINLDEIGPRFEMRLYRIILGTITQSESECEWQLKPFMNTSHKRVFIGERFEELSEDES